MYILIQEWYSKFIFMSDVCIYMYELQISSWPTDLSSSETVVHSFHTLELKIAGRPVGAEPFSCIIGDVISMGQSPEIHPHSHWMSGINTEVHPRSPEIF